MVPPAAGPGGWLKDPAELQQAEGMPGDNELNLERISGLLELLRNHSDQGYEKLAKGSRPQVRLDLFFFSSFVCV